MTISKLLVIKSKVNSFLYALIRLIRLRLSLMVTFSALTGFILTGSQVSGRFVFLLAGLFLVSAGASVLNQVQECQLDALMKRTIRRPIPAGEISRRFAALLALLLIVVGSSMLGYNGWIPVSLGLLNVLLYNFVYTPMKTRSWLAIIPGALVGGVPPLIGWTSAGFYLLHPTAIFLFIFVCLWQVPHFWLLMIKYGKEYESAGFSSISTIWSERQIKAVVYFWGVVTSFFLMSFPIFGLSLQPILLTTLIVSNLFFIGLFYHFLFRERTPGTVRRAFILINSYALLVFILLIVNALMS